ncbi:hypothetical protein [Pelomonas sp. KK5]|uniref:hypothetical protein n=1 Tax=Pelomonas sp. KK5 TaxID=1855730 RepID=UPI00097C452A|nr:hypothetical protein [Pelomonas sp. KK5]
MMTVLNTSSGSVPYAASSRSLGLATGSAFVVALLILVLFVLPAERGIDLTGIGAKLGLAQMRGGEASSGAAAARPATVASAAAALAVAPQGKAEIAKATPMRADDMSVVLPPHSGIEIKAEMKTGDHLIFRWESTAPVKMDMHGERPNAGDEFTRYWMESDLSGGQGAFTAPFDGRHGWFWRNRSDKEVTIKIHTAGFYEALFQPKH